MQTTIFDMLYPKYKIDKPVRLIELFSGYGSQALALKYLGIQFEHWKICEWAVKSIQAYKDIHFTDNNTDYSKRLNKDQLQELLFNKGISSNYNEPMSREQINRLNEDNLRTIYNNIIATHNLVNIQTTHAEDLEIVDTDKYCYIMTYSFPCQDLSLAGKGAGMSDTSTRSGLLWEVERILSECKELPQVLLMENVPQVHGEGNTEDFNKWQLRLEELGYKNYWEDLIATDYGIPQTRNRCFMISILGDYSYTFPPKQELKLRLKDMLENNVDEKFYLNDKQIKNIVSYGTYYTWNDLQGNINTQCCRAADENRNALTIACANTGNVLIKNATSKGYLEATDGDGIDISSRMEYHRGTVQKGKAQTLSTMGGENVGVVVGTYQYAKSDKFMNAKDRLQIGKDTSDTLQTTQKEGVVILGNYSPSNHEASRIVDSNYSAPTIKENHGTINATQTNDLRIRKLTPKECFRLMGVKDEDYEKCAKNQSNASLYHLAGDSIVVNVLMAIFKEIICYQ